MSTSPIIAVDGPAASGKGTLAKKLALALQFDHLDTGVLYRAVGRKLLDASIDPSNALEGTRIAKTLTPQDLMRSDLRGEVVARAASICSSTPGVRAALLDFQIQFAHNPPGGRGAILDGRDIGTAVCPQATVKLWVMASAHTRACRRHLEMVSAGDLSTSISQIEAAISERDEREVNRLISPLKPADDAFIIDTSDLTVDQVFQKALTQVQADISQAHTISSLRPSNPSSSFKR